MKELIIDALVENLPAVIEFIETELSADGCPIKTQTQIAIASEEVFVNIANYAYAPNVGGAVIRVSVKDEAVIEFEDSGKPYNPLEKDDPDITAPAEEREIGGLGIFITKQLMDSVTYRYADNKNLLVIRKSLQY